MGDRDIALELLPAAERETAAAIWRDVERVPDAAGLTCSWRWTETWLRHYGDVVAHRFAVGRRDGKAVGAALLTESASERRRAWRARRLHVGTAGEPPGTGIYVECNRLLAHPGDRVGFARALVAALDAERGWDELALDGFEEDQVTPLTTGPVSFAIRPQPSPTTDLRPARDDGDAQSLLRASVRQRVRRGIRGLGEVNAEWAATEPGALAVFDELVELHQRRWRAAGSPGAFASERAVGFHRELIRALLPSGDVMLFKVSAGTGTVGCLYGWIDRGRLLFYQSGFGEMEDARAKPGLVTHALALQACLERGIDEYDFLAGDSRYKRELSNTERTLVWAVATRRTPRAAAGRLERRAVAAVRRARAKMAGGAGRSGAA